MPLVRCPQCGRVADGRNCFACGYEWPSGGAVASTPPAAAPTAPQPPRTQPFASGAAPLTPQPQQRGMTPLGTPAPSTSPAGAPPRGETPPPLRSPASTNPFAANPKNPFQQLPPAVTRPPGGSSPGFTAPLASGSSPRFEPPRSFEPVPAPPPSFAMAPPSSSFMGSMPSMPAADEIVLDNELAFSLAGGAMDPQLGGGLPPPPPGLPPPPALAQSLRAPPRSDPAGKLGGGLDNIFDGLDIGAPKASPGSLSDPAIEAGDFLPKPTLQNENLSSPVHDPSGDMGFALGADLVSAFNAADTASLPAPGPIALDTRLRALAELLRGEGRTLDADLVAEAIAALQLAR
jgi:hypothetical protein